MSSSMQISGLVSGLDTASIIQQLIAIDSQPMNLLKQQQDVLNWQSNLLSSIKTNLFNLQQAVANLTLPATYSGRTTTSSDQAVATATAQNGAVNASYTVNVSQVATATTYVSSVLGSQGGQGWSSGQALVKTAGGYLSGNPADYNAQFGASSPNLGYFYINNARIDVTATDTINTIINKITASNAGVTASIVNDGTGDHVVLTQKSVGASKTININAGTGGMLTALHLDTATVTTAGQDADENRPLNQTALFSGMSSGYFSINGNFIYVDSANDTLNTVIAKINQSNAGVIASFDSNTKRITLTARTVGAGDITFGTFPGSDSTDFVARADLKAVNGTTGAIDPVKGGKLPGQEAQATINGSAVVTKNGQTTVNNVTFNLLSIGTTVVTVQNDVDKAVDAVKNFITQYNTVNDQLQAVLTDTPVKNPQSDADRQHGILFGDAMLTSLQYSLRGLLSATVSGVNSAYSQLSQIGITTGAVGSSVDQAKQGDLVLDENKLRQALADDPDAVASLLGKSNMVYGETITVPLGGGTTFNLQNKSLSQTFAPQVTVNGVTYTLVSGDMDAGQNQFTVDYTNGTITFSHALNAGDQISASYNYDTTHAGIATQFQNLLANYTRYGGTFDGRIGPSGSIPAQVKDLSDQIDSYQRRLDMEQQTLYNQFTAMELALNTLKNQGNWLTAQLNSLSSYNSSTK